MYTLRLMVFFSIILKVYQAVSVDIDTSSCGDNRIQVICCTTTSTLDIYSADYSTIISTDFSNTLFDSAQYPNYQILVKDSCIHVTVSNTTGDKLSFICKDQNPIEFPFNITACYTHNQMAESNSYHDHNIESNTDTNQCSKLNPLSIGMIVCSVVFFLGCCVSVGIICYLCNK